MLLVCSRRQLPRDLALGERADRAQRLIAARLVDVVLPLQVRAYGTGF